MIKYDGWIREENAMIIFERIQDKNNKKLLDLHKKYIKLIVFIVLAFTIPIFLFLCYWVYWYNHTPPTHNYVNNSTVEGSFNEK